MKTFAKDLKCCKNKCKEQAVAFWPIIDPDIPSDPYCRKHLDEAKMSLLIKFNDIDLKYKKKRDNKKKS